MLEYGLDCQSRNSKSCVVNDGSLSDEVLRVAIGYRGTRSKLFRFLFRSKRWPEQWRRRTSPGSSRTNDRVHFSKYFQQRDNIHTELSFSLCISTLVKKTNWVTYQSYSSFQSCPSVSGNLGKCEGGTGWNANIVEWWPQTFPESSWDVRSRGVKTRVQSTRFQRFDCETKTWGVCVITNVV